MSVFSTRCLTLTIEVAAVAEHSKTIEALSREAGHAICDAETFGRDRAVVAPVRVLLNPRWRDANADGRSGWNCMMEAGFPGLRR